MGEKVERMIDTHMYTACAVQLWNTRSITLKRNVCVVHYSIYMYSSYYT